MAKNPKTDKPPRKPRKAKDAADPAVAKKGHNSEGSTELTEAERQALFLSDKASLAAAKTKLAKVVADVRNVKKRIKSDGFTVRQVEAAIAMETAEGEAKIKAEMEEMLQAARWVGVAWGETLDMFMEPDRTPIADRAFEEGRRASMENKPANPSHSPETEAYRRYMEGFHEHQATIANGIKKPKGANVTDFPTGGQAAG